MMSEEQIKEPRAIVTLTDLLGAAVSVSQQKNGMINLTDTMKQEFISGVKTIKMAVSTLAYNYYCDVEFEPTADSIPLLRDVVESYAEAGGAL